MPQGKKYSAAQKHFEEKAVVLRREAKQYQTRAYELFEENLSLKRQLADAQTINAQQQEWIERLLEYTQLDIQDIKAACEKDKQMAQTLKVLNCFGLRIGG